MGEPETKKAKTEHIIQLPLSQATALAYQYSQLCHCDFDTNLVKCFSSGEVKLTMGIRTEGVPIGYEHYDAEVDTTLCYPNGSVVLKDLRPLCPEFTLHEFHPPEVPRTLLDAAKETLPYPL